MNWKWRGALALVAAAAGQQVWVQTHAPHSTLAGGWPGAGTPLDVIAKGILFGSLYMAAVYAFDSFGVALLRRIGRLLPVAGTGALALARHTLDSRRSANKATFNKHNSEMGGMVVLIAMVGAGLWSSTLDHAVHQQGQPLTWDAVVTPSQAGPTSGKLGAQPVALDPQVLSLLEATPGLIVVPVGQITVGATGPLLASSPRSMVYVVDPADLEDAITDGARPLGLQDGVVLSYVGTSTFPAPLGVVEVNTGKGQASIFHASSNSPIALGTRAWAEGVVGEVPVSGALVRATDASLSADAKFALIADAARAAGANARPALALSLEESAIDADVQRYAGFGVGFLLFLLVIGAVGTTLLLAVRTARAHRRVRATVAALGAPPRALVGAVGVDAGITLAVAMMLGVPLGALLAAISGSPTLGTPGAPLNLGETMWGLGWNLTHLSWQPVALAMAGTWILGVGVVFAYGLFTHRRTPVEELREAIKEGAL